MRSRAGAHPDRTPVFGNLTVLAAVHVPVVRYSDGSSHREPKSELRYFSQMISGRLVPVQF